MLTRLEQAQQHWGGSNNAIDNWLEERKDVLVYYCQLAGLPPYGQIDSALPDKSIIRRFCQLLMDYISAGHFEVYDQIVARCKENGAESMALAKKLYPRIEDSTDATLTFNDKFADSSDNKQLQSFDVELSQLGELLEERFELEDQLIEALYLKHS